MKMYKIKTALRENRTVGLLIIAIITISLWQVPGGNYILYPFTILGTWFHEMGHGLAAIMMGGNFHRLEIYSNGSGLAYHSGTLFLGNIGRAIVAMGGPLGPTFAGALLILSSARENTTRIALYVFGAMMIISAVVWVRSWFGVAMILFFGALTLFVAIKAGRRTRRWYVQLLGVQAIVSIYLSMDYLFSDGANVRNSQYLSDTAVISQNLFLPYWFWALLILAVSVFVIYKSIRYAGRQRKS
jgi:hypothetical protein